MAGTPRYKVYENKGVDYIAAVADSTLAAAVCAVVPFPVVKFDGRIIYKWTDSEAGVSLDNDAALMDSRTSEHRAERRQRFADRWGEAEAGRVFGAGRSVPGTVQSTPDGTDTNEQREAADG